MLRPLFRWDVYLSSTLPACRTDKQASKAVAIDWMGGAPLSRRWLASLWLSHGHTLASHVVVTSSGQYHGFHSFSSAQEVTVLRMYHSLIRLMSQVS
jgi:hypothetical protein